MSKTQKMEVALAVAGANGARGGGGAVVPQQRSARASDFDGGHRVIAFPARPIASRAAPSTWGANGSTNVVFFRPGHHAPALAMATSGSHVASFASSEGATREADDHSYRMFVNLLGGGALLALIAAGQWISSTLVHLP
jgi:hypothetical protein